MVDFCRHAAIAHLAPALIASAYLGTKTVCNLTQFTIFVHKLTEVLSFRLLYFLIYIVNLFNQI